MTKAPWQLEIPVEAIIFDCDGTLSTIEGIDELAKKNDSAELVKSLTAEAMGKSGMNPSLYKERLALVQPSQKQVSALGTEYYVHRVPDSEAVIAIFKRLKKIIYIISAGLAPAVQIFGHLLQIPPEHIFAVAIEFDRQGHFLDFDHHSPLVTRDGKRQLVNQLKRKHKELIYIGDGLNDYATHDLVRRFIGYGGAYYRENIAALCAFYIKTLSLAPLLSLSLTEAETLNLLPEEQAIYQNGLQAIQDKEVIIRKNEKY